MSECKFTSQFWQLSMGMMSLSLSSELMTTQICLISVHSCQCNTSKITFYHPSALFSFSLQCQASVIVCTKSVRLFLAEPNAASAQMHSMLQQGPQYKQIAPKFYHPMQLPHLPVGNGSMSEYDTYIVSCCMSVTTKSSIN